LKDTKLNFREEDHMRKQRLSGLFTVITYFLFLSAIIASPGATWAEYPERPVILSVGFPPGGTIDVVARALTTASIPALGQRIVVENKPGGSGTVVLSVLANTKPDGYTLAAVTSDALVGAPLMQKVPFKPLKSFTPIIGHSSSQHTALIVKTDAPWKSFDEFLVYAKKNPGRVKYSTAGVGTPMHVAMECIAHKEGIKWVHVPYNGQAPARTAVMGGHVDACSSGADWVFFAQSGDVRALVTYGHKRSPYSPNIPTLQEIGYDFVSDSIHLILGPAGLPPEVVQKLEAAFIKGTESVEVKMVQERINATPVLFTSKEYERYVKEQWTRAEKNFKEAGIIRESATQPY
jgi:tripartite-type tricarboxylate transporter receptor subunit TctC